MSHEGEAYRAEPGVMTFGEPVEGEVLAERYRLEERVDTDAAGRQIWRGIDVVLQRPVAIVIRQPGGEAAAAMLTAAVAASRLVHPHIVSVYDAIDEGDRAYLVREWVVGIALRDVLRQAPLDGDRSTMVTHAIAEAVAALHTVGIVHGNVHPGTILIGDDGRVVLADAPAHDTTDLEPDIRAIGAVLYACLTAQWPHAEAGHSALPDAIRDSIGRPLPPGQVRAGIPSHLEALAGTLLDHRSAVPPAAVVAAELAQLASTSHSGHELDEPAYDGAGHSSAGYHTDPYDSASYGASAYHPGGYDPRPDGSGPMGFHSGEGEPRRRAGGKLAVGVAVLATIAVAGALIGAKVLSSSGTPPGAVGTGGTAVTSSAPAAVGSGKPIPLAASQVRVVDPPKGDRTELGDVEKVVDGNDTTGWSTDQYTRTDFGGLKPGMGVLVDLGTPTKVRAVKVTVGQQGASVSLRTGNADPGSDSASDGIINSSYTTIGSPLDDHSGTVMVFPVGEGQQQVQYLLVWISKLPTDSKGKFSLAINEISVLAP